MSDAQFCKAFMDDDSSDTQFHLSNKQLMMVSVFMEAWNFKKHMEHKQGFFD